MTSEASAELIRITITPALVPGIPTADSRQPTSPHSQGACYGESGRASLPWVTRACHPGELVATVFDFSFANIVACSLILPGSGKEQISLDYFNDS